MAVVTPYAVGGLQCPLGPHVRRHDLEDHRRPGPRPCPVVARQSDMMCATANTTERLGRIQWVTDAALAHLDVSELLTELLDRTRELLQVDTAAVLLLDPDAEVLIATAARGIEEEVTQGVRIPFGRGFAGRIAAEIRPVILDRVDHTTVLNPILRDRGIRSLLGVPLVDQGVVLGVLQPGPGQRLNPRWWRAE